MTKSNFIAKGPFFILVVAILLSIVLLGVLRSSKGIPAPVDGVLDLTNWDFSKGQPSTEGEWEFYWNQLYTYNDFQTKDTSKKMYAYIPKTWNSYERNGTHLPGFGFATYRLKVIVNDTSQPLSFRLDTMSTAYRLYINNKEIASNGTVGMGASSSAPEYRPVTADFQPPAKQFYIIVQVSNFTYARGGIWYELNLGTHEQIETLNRTVIIKDAALMGSLLLMTLYYAGFYLVLQKDKTSLYFMLLCIIFMIRTSLYGDMFIIRLFPHISFGTLVFLTYITLYWIPIIIFLLINSIYNYSYCLKWRAGFVCYGIAATLVTAVAPVNVYTAFVTEIEIIGLGIAIFTFGIVIKAYRMREKEAGGIIISSLILLATGIHDVLYQANVIHHALGELASIGMFFSTGMFSFIIASRLSAAYNQANELSIQLGASLEKEKMAADELVKTELSFLKAQIKPHFLYNSLSVITALSTKNPQRTKELLYDLSDYLRGSFNFENYNGLTSLENELTTVRAYLSIEKERFQGKLNVEYDIDESINPDVPLLTIQPLVENAVRHGIMKKVGGGTVRLSVEKGPDCTVIKVQDDGVGFTNERLTEILTGKASDCGIGLKNIQRRLILHYGYGLEIERIEGKGTVITIKIPN